MRASEQMNENWDNAAMTLEPPVPQMNPPSIASEASWDAWVEGVCCAVQERSSGPNPTISVAEHVQASLLDD